jgi:AbiV family abortive infection protein
MQKENAMEIDAVGHGFEACWLNARELIEAAKEMKAKNRSGLSLSLAVLAMEEVGKMHLIDGLIFAKSGDDRHEQFRTGHLKHKEKLLRLEVFPLMLMNLAMLDPRYQKEEAYNTTLATAVLLLKEQKEHLKGWLGPSCHFRELDLWKQRGFYVHFDGKRFERPIEAIDENFSEAIVGFADRMIDTLTFILKGNIDRYKNQIRVMRETITDEERSEIRAKLNEMWGGSI